MVVRDHILVAKDDLAEKEEGIESLLPKVFLHLVGVVYLIHRSLRSL
jgi:hypothetical protein